jgi:hypothetical protein
MRLSEACNKFSPSKLISPPTILPGDEIKRITDRAVMDFPQPDSPTRPSSSPLST